MSLVTIVSDVSDIGYVRNLLTQAGRQHIKVRDDDLIQVFNYQTLYVDFPDVVDVAGIWLPDDLNHSGTNYASGATVYPSQGKISLHPSLSIPNSYREVMITYATSDGLSDQQIQNNVNIAKDYVQMELWETVDFSGSSTYKVFARTTMLTIGAYFSLLAMNNSNAIQSGYNYRIAEFEIQTKLWGEGMIAETLLNKYWDRSMKMLNALKIFKSRPDVPVYVVDRSNARSKYNGNPSIFNTMMNVDNVTYYDSKSKYAIILKIVG